ncbi:MAG: YggS family pyridoxal phosphate-dependent enzyme [Kiritimatiellae bacterium]|nr:YggS family pyridoxal phosphate-dependent enzyme [Kiritimatiellia bacterium]
MNREETIWANLETVRGRIAAACARSGRGADEVRLLAVSKTYGAEDVRAAARAGQRLFGENRVQEGVAKMALCPGNLEWHLIGHLQGNKAAAAARAFDWVHSVDSAELLRKLDRHAAEAGRRLKVLLQVNVSGEISKSGMTPDALRAMAGEIGELRSTEVRGLMTIPPICEDPEGARVHFRALRALRDEVSEREGLDWPELSMGMTHDMEVAVEEGATIVRVGTGIFGARDYGGK